MASKSLSTSTLSLRFMQNAHRAKQLKEVELERAEVKDDEKWEVGQEVRESWGTNRNLQSESSDVHETSYLPFLFSESDNTVNDINGSEAPRKHTGRRVFNKKGEMVPLVPSSLPKDTVPTRTPSSFDLTSSATRKVHARPVSISAGHLHGFDQLKTKNAKKSESARESIFENSGVGTDLRADTWKDQPTSTASTTFLKPVGVDDPKDVKATAVSNAEGVTGSARRKHKTKRTRDSTGELSEGNKRLKTKKNNPERNRS